MRNPGRLIQLFVVVTMVFISLNACAGMGSDRASTPVPTVVWFNPVNKPGMVNSDSIPVRRGPGVEYEQAATINHDYGITVVGQSTDGKWYKVEIPGYVGDQSSLWIAVDFVTVVSPTEMMTMTVVASVPSLVTTEAMTAEVLIPSPALEETITAVVLIPSPIATSQPSTSSCELPAGWVTYVIRPGDTLYGLAIKTKTTVDQLVRANCLTSNQIVTGSRLYLPFVPPADTQIPPQVPTPTASGTVPAFPTKTSLPIQTTTSTSTPIPFPTATKTPTPKPTLLSRQTPSVTTTPH